MSDFLAEMVRRKGSAAGGRQPAPRQDQESPPGMEAGPLEAEVAVALVDNQRAEQMRIVGASGLFDLDYYRSSNPDIEAAGVPPLAHFFDAGCAEGRRPNFYFEPQWYLDRYPDIRAAGMQPLFHFAIHGAQEGRQPGPFFNTEWYRNLHDIPEGASALAHYLRECRFGRVSPIPDFDVEFYTHNNPDILAAQVDPFRHFLESGFREGRNPSAEFDVKFYARRYLNGDLSKNPFLHWLEHKSKPGIVGRMPEDEATVPREVKRFAAAGPQFEVFQPLPAGASRRAKVLAYYLPQFHAFAENNEWWGTGFTEWTNVARALPRFKGHYQPRIPRDLGHYNLENAASMRRQAQMARAGGVFGFVFYYYWFNGRRLMERPIEQFLADRSIDMPFCLMWANENWTRRWDGFEREVLISQDYRPQDDEKMVAEFARHFRDERYIRLEGGRPLLMVYRPRLIPEPRETIERWRAMFRDGFKEDPILIMAQGFGDTDPTEFGLDGAIEFPPHKLAAGVPPVNDQLEILDPDFTAQVVPYDTIVQKSVDEPVPAFPLIKCAIPSWDNDARRQGAGMVVQGSTPAKYEAWLSRLVAMAGEHPFFGEPLVCVNAWNEWAEAAYLEPDVHFGAAYLNATGRAVAGLARRTGDQRRMLLIGHDAHPHGAQELLLRIGETLRRQFGVEIQYLLLEGGRLEKQYEEIAPVSVLTDRSELRSRLADFRDRGFSTALVNTTAAASAVKPAADLGIACTMLVHELPRIIEEKNFTLDAQAALRYARNVVFPAAFVRESVLRALDVQAPKAELHVQPQGVYKPITPTEEAAERARASLGIAPGERLVLGIGYADLRKGFDLFLQLWRLLQDKDGPRTHFCWLGNIDITLRQWLGQELDDAIAGGTFHLPGFTDDVAAYFSVADAFALTSREDPFPSVALEALSAGVPVVAFERSGGIPDLLREHGVGINLPYGDVLAMANALRQEFVARPGAAERRLARQELMAHRFPWKGYVWRLLELGMPDLAKVSVAVPNYNYERYMPSRLGSIFAQTYPVQEVVVLDDCSTDNSLAVIPEVAAEWRRHVRLLPNTTNSGSVFAQWRKAAETATGDFLWIAEADDLADPALLDRLLAPLRADPEVRFAFCDSRAIDSDGKPLGPSYKPYYATVEPNALTRSQVFEAPEFVERFLSVKNLILNVSAVVWRRDALLRALDRCGEDLRGYRMAGDWRLYLEALAEPGARIAYEAEALNVHRRHAQSVTHALNADRHVAEIAQVHALAGRAFGLKERTLGLQRDYLREVSAQLKGAPVADAPARQAGENTRPAAKKQKSTTARSSHRAGRKPAEGKES